MSSGQKELRMMTPPQWLLVKGVFLYGNFSESRMTCAVQGQEES